MEEYVKKLHDEINRLKFMIINYERDYDASNSEVGKQILKEMIWRLEGKIEGLCEVILTIPKYTGDNND